MQLDPLQAVLSESTYLGWHIFQVWMHSSKGDQLTVLNADEPVVGPFNLGWMLYNSKHNGLVKTRDTHMGFDTIKRVGRDGRVAELMHHGLQYGASDPIRPYVGMYVYLHRIFPVSVAVDGQGGTGSTGGYSTKDIGSN